MANRNLFFREFIKEETKAVSLIGMKKKKPTVVFERDKQVGTSNTFRDSRRVALPPGKRVSKSGKIYYESRKNRSDLTGSNL